MIFETLFDSARKGGLILVDGGYCRFHLRRDGQVTIHEIISQRPGAGQKILTELKTRLAGTAATSLFAKCPTDLESNAWWKKRGFELEQVETLSSGRKVNHWRYLLDAGAISATG